MSGEALRWVQHPNLVELADGTSHAGVLTDGEGQMQVVAVWADRDTGVRIWRRMHAEPGTVCQNLGVPYDKATVVDVGRLVEERRVGSGWRPVRVVCEQARVLDRRPEAPGLPGTDWKARMAGHVANLGGTA